jgi:hypothetical protein
MESVSKSSFRISGHLIHIAASRPTEVESTKQKKSTSNLPPTPTRLACLVRIAYTLLTKLMRVGWTIKHSGDRQGRKRAAD